MRGRFVDFTSLVQDLQSAIDPDAPFSRNELLAPIENAEVLVVDELGAQTLRPWAADVLYDLINRRYARRLPTLFTTNYQLDDPAARNEASPTADRAVAELRGPRAARAARAAGSAMSERLEPPLATHPRHAGEPPVGDGAGDEPRRGQGLPHGGLLPSARHVKPDGAPLYRWCWRSVVAFGGAAIAARVDRRRHRCAAAALPLCGGAIVVRVGLETDLRRFVLPCCEPVWVEHGGTRRSIATGLEVTPGGQARKPNYKLQVAALKDEDQARAIARSLERSTGAPAQVSFDVVVVALPGAPRPLLGTCDAADRLGHRLVDQGVDGAWVVEEGGGLEHAALTVARRRAASRRPSRRGAGSRSSPTEDRACGSIAVVSAAASWSTSTIAACSTSSTSSPLEDYLRGVVPVEMGPELYDSLDSLKAQAVAARTYTVRGLGGFLAEGFDLCASPRCQVYGGMDAEHPLSDRAVAETAGEIVHPRRR